ARDGGQPLLHGLARRERHGQQDAQLRDARRLSERRQPAPRIPRPHSTLKATMLVRLLYVSRAADNSAKAIEGILEESRQHNTANGITGVLCYGAGIFLQAIEGG